MRTAIVGTSHVNAFRAAVETTQNSSLPEQPIFFFALNAPILSKENSLGWQGASGTMSCRTDVGRAFLKRVFSQPDLIFDPAEFDRILLVDFFFCCDYAFLLRNREVDSVSVDGRLISHALFKEVMRSRLGKSQYAKSSAVGDVSENSLLPLLSDIRTRAPEAQIYLTPRPFQPTNNKTYLKIGLSAEEINLCYTLFNSAAEEALSPIGITWCSQPIQTIDKASGLTADTYSIGAHATLPGQLDEHLNAIYGEQILSEIQWFEDV